MWEVKDAAKRYASLETGNSLLARIKANKRLMNELASLGIPEEEIKRYLPILSNYLDHLNRRVIYNIPESTFYLS